MGDIGVGIIGFGYWGPMLVRNFEDCPGARVAWVCERNPERRAAVGERYPQLKVFDELDAALAAGADAAVVATPPTTHEGIARRALESGMHVLVEKPMAMSGDGVVALDALAREQGRTLMAGHILRYNPAVQTIRSIISEGDLGEIRYVATTRVNLGRHHKDVNVIWDLGPHDLSAILYLLGARPDAVSAWGRSFIQPGLADVAFLYLRFRGGQIGHVHLSWLDPLKVRQMIVVGSRKMLVYDDVEVRVTVHDRSVEQIPHAGTLEEFRLAYRYGDEHDIFVEKTEPLAVECAHFVDCVRHGKDPETGAREAFEVVRSLEAAQASLDTGGAEVAIDWQGRW